MGKKVKRHILVEFVQMLIFPNEIPNVASLKIYFMQHSLLQKQFLLKVQVLNTNNICH